MHRTAKPVVPAIVRTQIAAAIHRSPTTVDRALRGDASDGVTYLVNHELQARGFSPVERRTSAPPSPSQASPAAPAAATAVEAATGRPGGEAA